MNDLVTVLAVVGVACAVFGAMWMMLQDVKKGVHARVERCEHVVDTVVADCKNKKDDFITISAFDRFEKHMGEKVDGVKSEVVHLTKRIDDWITVNRRNNAKTN